MRTEIPPCPKGLCCFVSLQARSHDAAQRLVRCQCMPRTERQLLVNEDLARRGLTLLRLDRKGGDRLVGRLIFRPLLTRVLNGCGVRVER